MRLAGSAEQTAAALFTAAGEEIKGRVSYHCVLITVGQAVQRLQRQRSSEDSELESQTESDKSSATTWSQESQPHDDGDLYALAAEIWPAAVALAVSSGCATLVFPFFTFVKSSGWLKALLPQVSMDGGISESKVWPLVERQ